MNQFPKIIFLTLFLYNICEAQISIGSNDLLGLIGSSIVIEEDTSENITVDVGPAGENQTWDLSGITLADPYMLEWTFEAPAGTPFESTFPTANLVNKLTFPDIEEDLATYLYMQITPNEARQLGSGTSITSMGMTFSSSNEFAELIAPLPINYGDSWTFVFRDTTEEAGILTNFVYDSTITMVDGWGTLKLPGGDFPCLRLFERSFTSGDTYVNGVLSGSFDEEDISYIWVSKNNFLLATMTSQEGETNPNFTNASSFNRQVSGITPALDVGLSNDNHLAIVGANPFSQNTVIEFTLKKRMPVELYITDLSGLKIRTLIKGIQPEGKQQISWEGVDALNNMLPTGTYLVVLKSEKGQTVKKLQLVH